MNKRITKLVIAAICLIVVGLVIFNAIYGNKDKEIIENDEPIIENNTQETKTDSTNREMPEADGITDELTRGLVVSQDFVNTTENINEIAVVFSRIYYLEEKDSNLNVVIELLDGNKTLIKSLIKSNDVPDQHRVYAYADSPISGYVGKKLTLKIYEDANCDTGLVLMRSEKTKKSSYKFGNKKKDGSICFSITGE